MVWVRSEYAGELAVLSTWFSALIPWNVTFSPNVAGGTVLFVRFPLFQVRYTFGLSFAKGTLVGLPVPAPLADTGGFVVSAIAYQAGQSIQAAYWVWAAGALVYAVALGLSVAYYLREERVEAGPIDPVSTLGGLLVLSGLVLGGATVLLYGVFPGVPIPLGILFMVGFGAVLLRAERRA